MKNRPIIRLLSIAVVCVVFLGLLFVSAPVLAAPTLVVDVDTGSISLHVGDTGPLPLSVLSQSGGNGGTTLMPGAWGPMTGFQIFSPGGSLNGDGDAIPDVLSLVFPETTQSYSEGAFVSTTIAEGMIFSLTTTYNTSLDLRDLDFTSVMGASSTPWNTLYIGAVPEPSTLAIAMLGSLGIVLRSSRRRR